MKAILKWSFMVGMIIIFICSMVMYIAPQPVLADETSDLSGLKIIISATVVGENGEEIDVSLEDGGKEDMGNPKGKLPQTGGFNPIAFYIMGGIVIAVGAIVGYKLMFLHYFT